MAQEKKLNNESNIFLTLNRSHLGVCSSYCCFGEFAMSITTLKLVAFVSEAWNSLISSFSVFWSKGSMDACLVERQAYRYRETMRHIPYVHNGTTLSLAFEEYDFSKSILDFSWGTQLVHFFFFLLVGCCLRFLFLFFSSPYCVILLQIFSGHQLWEVCHQQGCLQRSWLEKQSKARNQGQVWGEVCPMFISPFEKWKVLLKNVSRPLLVMVLAMSGLMFCIFTMPVFEFLKPSRSICVWYFICRMFCQFCNSSSKIPPAFKLL